MKRDELGDLSAFLAVIEAGSFTKAAAQMGTSQSALSHTVARLEARLGLRLLNRTTRRVGPTEAGEQLAATLRPCFDEIEARLASLSALRDKPAGLVRISSSALAAEMILWPMIEALAPDYPEVRIEVNVESRFTDIVAERFDAGVRLGESLDRDMIAVRIGPDMSMALVASPDYLGRHGSPSAPQDLVHHACINLRLPTMGNLYAWEFAQNGRPLNVRVEGPLTFNLPGLCLNAARAGLGLAFVPEPYVTEDLAQGRLVRLLAEWCPVFPGFHLYYPSRRQTSPAMALVVQRLRWRG
ncbi:LysR family transcriptional regulator [Cypionkella sinensis]|uniref:LysR family transcriptional regulator n=1 Tax=Cypionkella sinensis TaxID=1756043 RepID=A0ABV7J330_9RHOB